MASAQAAAPERAIGTIGLTAIAINGMVGAGIFALPANVAQILGPSSILAYLTAGGAVFLIALCYAEAGSRFENSGGPYLHAREAFGPFAGFQVGMMLTLSRIAGAAAISNAFSSYAGYLWPGLGEGLGRAASITAVLGVLTWINCLGVRPGVRSIIVLTVGKLAPLFVFCAVGLFFVRSTSAINHVSASSLKEATLLLIYAFGGFEFATIPSAEVKNPRRVLPVVLGGSVAFVVLLYVAIQWVALGTYPDLARSTTPLASAAQSFLGGAGGALLAVGAVLSTTGTNSASILIGSRMLYAIAEGRLLPSAFARLHPRYHTPILSTLAFAIPAWGAALIGTFGQLAALGAISRVIYYTSTCLAVPVLRKTAGVSAGMFALPGGLTIPVLALAVCGWLLSGTTQAQAEIVVASLAGGALLYFTVKRGFRAS